MKKITFITLAISLFASYAMAEQLVANTSLEVISNSIKTNEIIATNAIQLADEMSNLSIVVRKADSESSVEGTWAFSLGDYYLDNRTNSTITYNYVAQLQDTIISFVDPNGARLPFLGIYDKASGKITFPVVKLGLAQSYYVAQMPYVYDAVTNEIAYQTITAYFANDMIKFDANNGMTWPAFTDADFSIFAGGYFGFYDFEGAVKVATGLESLEQIHNAQKVLKDGQILIIRQDGKSFNIQGAEVK